MLLGIVIVSGLIAGSFLTAFVDRLADGRSFVKGRSSCDSCQKRLTWLDLIPLVSYLLAKGKCRHCKKSIGTYYLIVEISTLLSFMCFYWFWPFDFVGWNLVVFSIWLLVLTMLLALIIYDFKWMILPSKIIYPTMLLAIVLLGCRYLAGHDLIWWQVLLGIVVGGGIFHLIFMMSERYIGYGDVRLGFLLGMLLASWQLSLLMIFLSSILGVLVTLPIVAIKGKQALSEKFKIPFGPFLILGALISFSFGQILIDWYLTLGA